MAQTERVLQYHQFVIVISYGAVNNFLKKNVLQCTTFE
jgi:hypothetical protein